MATLLLSAVGTALGGPIGGAIGALIGRQAYAALIGSRKIQGPRLKEIAVQTSSYGSYLPLHFGTVRATGSVIWATELKEHSEKSGGGKGRPAVTSYSYTASFAVAVSGRPISGIGRIWADGNLLRGSGGDLKVGGILRVYTGYGDQTPDPLLVQAEGAGHSPAYRHLAYVVFEDLALAEFGNRLPSLTFEIFADPAHTSMQAIIEAASPIVDAPDLAGHQIQGFSMEQGSAADVISVLSDVDPLSCLVIEERVRIRPAEAVANMPVATLPWPATGGPDAEEAKDEGWSRRRLKQPTVQQSAVRYYDPARDYQPGLQRSVGRVASGEVETLELPAVMSATDARDVANRLAQRRMRAADRIRYRVTEIGEGWAPGAVVRLPVIDGQWRIDEWEWQADGVLLDLAPLPMRGALANVADPGRLNNPIDLAAVATQISAFELPWNGVGNDPAAQTRFAATAANTGWRGAAIYLEQANDVLVPLGSTGRRRAVAGRSTAALPGRTPLLLDALSELQVELASVDFALANATWAQAMHGANMALLGGEYLQFLLAEQTGERTWTLRKLLRGRGGSEAEVFEHENDEPFVLLSGPLQNPDIADEQAVLDNGLSLLAIGAGDAEPVRFGVSNPGFTSRPLAPVHGRSLPLSNGSCEISWVRRSRGAWTWPEEVEVPLNEEAELWEISAGPQESPFRVWQSSETRLIIDGETMVQLASAPELRSLSIVQIGRRSRSRPLSMTIGA